MQCARVISNIIFSGIFVQTEAIKLLTLEVNPHLAAHTPGEVLEALKRQFKAYLAGDPPFDQKQGLRESPGEWLEHLLAHDDAAVLAVSSNLPDLK